MSKYWLYGVIFFCLISFVYTQDLPKSLFPNQEIYDIDMLLQQSANFDNSYILQPSSHTNQWTLKETINLAILNNLELAQAKKDLDSSKSLYTGSIQDFYVPNLTVSASADFRNLFTTSGNPNDIAATSEGFKMDLSLPSIVLSKTIFNGFANLYSYRIAKENYLNLQNTYTNKIREIVYQTAIRYYDQFLKQEEVKVTLERLRQLRDQLAQAEINYRNGRVSDFDVSLSRSQFYSAQPTYFTAEKNRLFSKEDFYRYIGYVAEPDTFIELKGDLLQVTNIEFSPFDENSSLEYIFSNDTMLATLRAAYQNAKNQKGQQNAVRLPKVDLRFDYNPSWGRDVAIGSFGESSYNGQYGVSASLQVPILEWIPGTGVASRVKAADTEITKAQYALLDAEEQKLIEVKNTLLTIREMGQSVNSFRVSEEQARRASEIAQEQYRFGRISIIELNQAQVDYIDAKRNLLLSVYNELNAKLTLQQAINSLPRFLEEMNKIQINNMVE
ncbi:MAG: TolC family protein [Brevinema sp.]